MQETPLQNESLPAAAAARSDRYIYIACPWTPVGGGMYKVADYLIQSQAADPPAHAAQLRPLDSRGGGQCRLLAVDSRSRRWRRSFGAASTGASPASTSTWPSA